MDEINAIEYFTINPDAVYTFIDHEAIMISSRNEEPFSLNETAAEILKQLEFAPASIKHLSEYILAHYDIDEVQCMIDVKDLITSLLAKQLIIRVN